MEYFENITIDYLKEKLNDSIVVFDYKKKDGTIRTARGTVSKKIINEYQEPGEIKLQKKFVDIIIKEHKYNDVFEYASENDCVFIDSDDTYYYFNIKKRYREPNPNQTVYFDLDKMCTRSFVNENYIGIIKVENHV